MKSYIHTRSIVFGDCDPAGIVYAPNYTDYAREAIEAWLKQDIGLDWYTINTKCNEGTSVVHLEIDFLNKLQAGDLLQLAVGIDRVGSSSFTVAIHGFISAKTETIDCFKAMFVFCYISKSDRCSMPIPADYREKLVAYKTADEQDEC